MIKRLLLSAICASFFLFAHTQDNRIEYNGQSLFLSGTNLAWVDFARDIGPGETDFMQFGTVFKEMQAYGANSVRLWLHTNGTATPEFTSDTVSGPGVGAIDDLRQILDSAYQYDVGVILCLWSFDMLRESIGEPYLTRNRKLLEEEEALNSYLEYALKPLVDSTKNHPAILAWEVFNEPEGMIPDAFWGGWSGIGHVTRQDVQRVINKVAGTIHRISPELKVTSGAHNMHSLTDVGGDHNFYSDSALFNVGGDADGFLDFYQVHFYDFPLNPFEHHYDYWNLDKPLLLGEFHPGCDDCGDFSNYQTLIDSGYAGAMGWMWLDSYGESIKEELQYFFHNNTAEVDIDNMLGDTPYLTFSGPEYGTVFESGADVSFSAVAFDSDGTVEKVDFILSREIQNDSVLYSATSSPYNFTWANPDDGIYNVYAMAIDNDGYSKTSQKLAFTIGDPPRYRYEAEEAVLEGGLNVNNDTEASNGKYVSIQSDCSIKWTIPNCPADGAFDMIIGFAVPNGNKNNYFIINDATADQLDIAFAGPSDAWLRDTIQVDLLEGANTIEIVDFWGWMDFDFIEFSFPRPPYAKVITLSTESGLDYIDQANGTLQMIASIEPEEAAIYPVEWRINNNQLASISQDGLLTALKNGVVTVIAEATDGSGISNSMDITISNQPTGLWNNFSETGVYPNPVITKLFFKEHDIYSVRIFDLQGQLKEQNEDMKGQGYIDLGHLKKGVYLISIVREDGNSSSELIYKE